MLAAVGLAVGLAGFAAVAVAALVETTIRDLHLPGTQSGDVPPGAISTSSACKQCHGVYDIDKSPYSTWEGSLMAQAGRDPLFYAQMTTANQDVANAGYFCMRCHVPLTFVTGHAYPADGSAIDDTDRDGVSCHFCHSMVDPIYKPGVSPAEDEAILDALDEVPSYYGNSMFVLDPTGTRRGPFQAPAAAHTWLESPFHRTGDLCGTCHDVGNVAVSLQPDGTYRYNALDEPTPSEDLHDQFPLERTYTEWKLSAFAGGGVDMGGRFGGNGATVVSTCQDCHMPRTTGAGCAFGPTRTDLPRHDFAGAAAQVLDLIAAYTEGDPAVDQAALARARAKSVSMLERTASLDVSQASSTLDVRETNETGHKIPTGHIEGRRIWINVKFFGRSGALLAEHGHYDEAEAELDEASTTVYEMQVGLSDDASIVTGLPAGVTTHMALADTIEKDNRIPPRGFTNAAFDAGGAPVVGWTYADGQHWDDAAFPIPGIAVRAEVSLFYQNTPRHYIEALRDGNVTDDWGDTLHQLWEDTGRGAPLLMTSATLALSPPCTVGDCDGDGVLPPDDCDDYDETAYPGAAEACDGADDDCDGAIDEGNPGGGAVCGTDVGECATGVTDCQAGALVCIGGVEPAAERCDSLDNDCDGQADEGFDPDTSCTVGIGACAAPGVKVCTGDGSGTACSGTPGTPTEEFCDDATDDDCDGATDEAGCTLCRPENTIAAPAQTRQTRVLRSLLPGKDRLNTRGVFTLPAPGAIAPGGDEVTLSVTDGTGAERYRAEIPAGGLQARGAGNVFVFRDVAAPYELDNLARAELRIAARSRVTTSYRFRARGLDLPAFATGTGTVTVKVGQRCFVDGGDSCTTPPNGTVVTCR